MAWYTVMLRRLAQGREVDFGMGLLGGLVWMWLWVGPRADGSGRPQLVVDSPARSDGRGLACAVELPVIAFAVLGDALPSGVCRRFATGIFKTKSSNRRSTSGMC